MCPEERYAALRRMAELGQEIERRRGPDPYPRPTGPAPSLAELRHRRDELEGLATRHGAANVRVFGSVARGDAEPGSDVDFLVDGGERFGLFDLAALQRELEDLLGCPVHVTIASGLRHAREDTRKKIEREAVAL